MKTRIKFLIILFALFILNLFVSPYNYAQESQERSLWVWSATNKIIDDYFSDTNGTAREEFLSFCAAPHGNPSKKITKLYMSAYDRMQFQPDRMRRFLADMNNRGFKVYIVIADPKFAMPTYNPDYRRSDPNASVPGSYEGCFNESFEKIIIGSANVKAEFDYNGESIVDDGIIGILPFQKASLPSERFTGIMLDIEPYQLGHGYLTETPYTWERNFDVVWRTYVYLISFCRDRIDAYNNDPLISDPMEFSDAFGAGFQYMDDGNISTPSKNLFDTIFEKVDFFTLMAYRDFAGDENTDGIISMSKDVVAKAATFSKKCSVTVETTYNIEDADDIDSRITFYDNDTTVLENELSLVYANFGASSGFGGFSIHSYADTATAYRGYQNMLPITNKHAPITTIKTPNGLRVDGINFIDSIDISWEVYNPDNLNYNISLSYKKQNDSNWTSITTLSNIPSTTTAGSYTWDITGIQTTPSNRLFIKAEISYNSGDPLTTFDTTDYPVAVNESATINMDGWSETYNLFNIKGSPQGLQIIPGHDNDVNKGVLHAVYYYFYEGTMAPGIYYSKSVDWGKTWSYTKLLTPDSLYDNDGKSTWPRKPALAVNDKYVGVVWVENSTRLADKETYNQRIYAQFNDNDGNYDDWQSSKIPVVGHTGYERGRVDFPSLYMESNANAHIVWNSLDQSNAKSQIEYAKYAYSAGAWSLSDTIKTVEEVSVSAKKGVKTPSVCLTNAGIHVVWSEYTELIQGTPDTPPTMRIVSKTYVPESSSTETVFSENFDSYSAGTDPNAVTAFPWLIYGSLHTDRIFQATGSDVYLRINFSSAQNVRLFCGMAQDSNWVPAKNFTGSTISFKIRSNLATQINSVITAEIVARVQNLEGVDQGYDSTFRLLDANLLPIPSSSQGWVTVSIDVTTLRDRERWWARPILTQVRKAQILIIEEYTDIIGSGYVEINDFKAERVISSGGWGTAVEIAKHEYGLTEDQIQANSSTEDDIYPVYFPKITSFDDKLYCVWQLTTRETDSDMDSYPRYSLKYFSKSTNGGASWLANPIEIKNDADNDTNGYVPAISVVDKNNDGTADSIQVVYVSDLASPAADTILGNLYFTESSNDGQTWSERELLVSKTWTANRKEGILNPYQIRNGVMGVHYFSMPFVFTCPNAISITNWIGYNQSNADDKLEQFKLRGINFLKYTSAPSANLIEGQNGFKITWDVPDRDYAPNFYNLYRITDNDPSTKIMLNGGLPIYSLSYLDLSAEITGNHYYRYEVSFTASSIPSISSIGSNGIKLLSELLIDDFEVDAYDNSYTGTSYKINNDYEGSATAMSYEIANFPAVDSDRILYIKYTPLHLQTPTNFYINFPAKMDFSGYGSINVWMKLKSGSTPRKVICNVYELLSSESEDEILAYYTVYNRIDLIDDGEWHLYRFYLDKFDENKYPTLKNIKACSFGFYETNTLSGSTEFYVDDIMLSNELVLEIDKTSITYPDEITNNGMIKGVVINNGNPVNVNFGNGRNAWYLRIYTLDEIENDGQPVKITKHGLIRKEGDIIYPEFNMPIKVWCKNFGPARFFNPDTGLPYINPSTGQPYYPNGYPPIENDYFFKGYNFNHDKEGRTWDLIPYINASVSTNKIVEGTGPGQYNFDIDGDGFKQGDDFFGITNRLDPNFRDRLSESGAWLFVPLFKTTGPWPQERDQDLKDFVIMDPANTNTWRKLATYQNDIGNHQLTLYFAAYVGLEQCGFSKSPSIAYGNYSGTVVIDLVYN